MEICLVGGSVRDQLLGLEVKDRDWVVIGATPEEMRQQGYRPVGKDFPVFINPETGEEFALARTERKSGHGYQGFTFHTDPSVTLEEDLLRRDLTINAMAIRSDGTLVDPYHGQQDITHRILRHISPAFAEDPLRVLRVARFAARFTPLGFSIATETLSLMQQISDSGELTHLSAERIWSEFERALQGEHPLVFLTCLQQANALESTLAEFKQLNWAFAAIAMKRLNSLHPSAEQRFALLCYLALEDMPEKNALKNFCARLRAPKRFQQAAGDLIEWGKVAASFNKQSSSRRLEMVKEMKLLRQPERLTCLLPTSMALHPDMQDHLTEPLWAMLEQLRQVTATQWIEKGLQGRAVGEAMEQEYLRIISRF